jgi:hypothetical protein
LQRAARRRTPVAFWYFGNTHLVVATMRAGDEEPLMLSCAAVHAEWLTASPAAALPCPGFLELHRRFVSEARLHAAAVAAANEASGDDILEVEESGQSVRVALAGIDHVVDLFHAARLPLVWLACETTARDHLLRHFGPADGKRPGERSLADDPLAAVSVAPACESAAARLGELLAVPVGLALASFGVSEDR